MDITSDRKILDMVEHCHLGFTENPYQQYPKPQIKLNSEEAAIIVYHFSQEKEKWFLQINVESKRTECIHRVSTF